MDNPLVKVDQPETIVVRRASPAGEIVQVRTKAIKVHGRVFNIDPYQLIRMIKNVTQTIGEYKEMDNPYAAYTVHALRKSRSDMISDLENHFHIHWQLDNEGNSVFFLA